MSRFTATPAATSPRGEPEVVHRGVAFTYPTLAAAQAAVLARDEARGEGR